MTVTHDKAMVLTTYRIKDPIHENYYYYLFLRRISSVYLLHV